MLIALVVFLAALVQGVLGFGGALIAMPLLVTIVGIQTAAPAFALVSILATLLNAIHWRAYATPRDLVQLIVPAVIGIPIGVLVLARVDADVVTRLLGAILILYAGFNLLGRALPPLRSRNWAYLAGFSSGVLSGAFNTGGPPVIVFANARGWSAEQFRANLQTYFLLTSLFLVASHAVTGHLTPVVLRTALLAIPALLVGQFLGLRLCRYINPTLFRRVVLFFLLLLGAQLLFF